jgi:hypothetical protein
VKSLGNQPFWQADHIGVGNDRHLLVTLRSFLVTIVTIW